MWRFVKNMPACLLSLLNLFHDHLTMPLSWSMRQLHLPGDGNFSSASQNLPKYKSKCSKCWIRPSVSPYGAPLLFVHKKTGKLRMCINYHALNRQTKLDVFPIPSIADLLEHLGRAHFFSSVDLATAYYQIRIKQGHAHCTAFATPQGLYKWIVMLLGLTNAPAMFQRSINHPSLPAAVPPE